MGEGVETFGKYQLVRRLAFGGMAEIFLARLQGEQGFAKRVVLKRILPQYGTDENFVRMFIDEAVIAARLTHPNVVQVYDFGDVNGVYYIAMEWVDGLDLSQVLKKQGAANQSLSAAQVAAIGEGICRGLGYAHNFAEDDGRALQIVHRDISPHNIMLSRSGEPKVMDFGIAKAEERATRTRTGMIKGKIAYMAPEQVQGKPLDKRADQFSVGLVLWECLTGNRVFTGDTDFELLRKVTECNIVPPSQVRADVPPELDRIVMRAVSASADDRYPDLADLEQELSAFRFSLGAQGAVKLGQLVDELSPRRPSGAVRQTTGVQDGAPPSASSSSGTKAVEELGAGERTGSAGTFVPGPGGHVPTPQTQPEAPPASTWSGVDEATAAFTASSWGAGQGLTQATLATPPESTALGPGLSTGLSTDLSEPQPRGAHERTFPEQPGVSVGPPRRSWVWPGVAVAVAAVALLAALVLPKLLRGKPTEGTLIVRSQPAGAQVKIQGASVGLVTPAPIPNQPLGQPLQVEVNLEGYVTGRQVVTLTEESQEIILVLVEEAPAVAALVQEEKAPSEPAPPPAAAQEASAPDASAPTQEGPGPEKERAGSSSAGPSAPQRAAKKGQLSLRIRSGWATVYLGKKKLGNTPLMGVEVPAGRHTLRLVNPELGIKKSVKIKVEPNGHTKESVTFP